MSGPARSGVDRLPREVRRPLRLRFLRRRAWRNHLGNQSIDPLRIYAPESRDEIVAIVKAAEADGAEVRSWARAIWSDVALTDGYLVQPHRARAAARPRASALARRRRLGSCAMEAGMRVRELNEWLDGTDLASNMGGYDGQTVAGVISTSTHGSGIAFGPLADSVRVDRRGSRADGRGLPDRAQAGHRPTPATWPARRTPATARRRTTRGFEAVKVGMGCLGVIHSLMLEVEPGLPAEARCARAAPGSGRGGLRDPRGAPGRTTPLRAPPQPLRRHEGQARLHGHDAQHDPERAAAWWTQPRAAARSRAEILPVMPFDRRRHQPRDRPLRPVVALAARAGASTRSPTTSTRTAATASSTSAPRTTCPPTRARSACRSTRRALHVKAVECDLRRRRPPPKARRASTTPRRSRSASSKASRRPHRR